MSEAIKIEQVNAQLLTRVCTYMEGMSDADLDALCLMIEAEMTARKEYGNRRKKN